MEIKSGRSPQTSTNTFSFKDQNNYDYFLNRDPLEEFFTLTC